eukprot:TRINITY_DN222_c0_g2_i1.p2 TRINITY_DN222_c0_g2~~TRINITY_DN222_c0_g2_i1.p2  ORF type:complete len:174 (-),score=35.08 TRINITY_DN222_c0_g2_i1:640-1161(-)
MHDCFVYCFLFILIILIFFFFLMIRRPPRSTHCISSAASDVYKRQLYILVCLIGTQYTFYLRKKNIFLLTFILTLNSFFSFFYSNHKKCLGFFIILIFILYQYNIYIYNIVSCIIYYSFFFSLISFFLHSKQNYQLKDNKCDNPNQLIMNILFDFNCIIFLMVQSTLQMQQNL